jgi:hypothetical protein
VQRDGHRGLFQNRRRRLARYLMIHCSTCTSMAVGDRFPSAAQRGD